jgi:hypothetical protein
VLVVSWRVVLALALAPSGGFCEDGGVEGCRVVGPMLHCMPYVNGSCAGTEMDDGGGCGATC